MITATLEPTDTMPAPPKTRLAGIDRIVLTGFMGSGKTSTGRRLAETLGWPFLDLDHEIERRQSLTKTSARTIPEIFAQHGEAHFRRLESAALVSLLGQHSVVIALGGGAPEELGNRLLLEQTPNTAVIYLAAPFDILLHRCNQQALDPTATARPNLANPDAAAHRFQIRHPHYLRIAAHTLDTSALTPEQTASAILDLLQSAGRSR